MKAPQTRRGFLIIEFITLLIIIHFFGKAVEILEWKEVLGIFVLFFIFDYLKALPVRWTRFFRKRERYEEHTSEIQKRSEDRLNKLKKRNGFVDYE